MTLKGLERNFPPFELYHRPFFVLRLPALFAKSLRTTAFFWDDQTRPFWTSQWLLKVQNEISRFVIGVSRRESPFRTIFTPRGPMLFALRGRGAFLIMPRPWGFSGTKWLRSWAFCWCIVCFCTTNGSFRILKKAGDKIFLIFVILRNCGNNLISKNFLQPFSIFWKNHW